MVHLFCSALLLFLEACSPELRVVEPIVASQPSDRVVFLAVGRQGYGDDATGQVAASMERIASDQGDINFAILLGDNFYPEGVTSTSDRQWITKFENLYDGPHLRGMPFYASLGNHDHQGDINAQLQYAREGLGTGRFRMEAPFYSFDVGAIHEQPLARIVVLDSVALSGIGTYDHLGDEERTRDQQLAFLRSNFADGDNSPVWRIVVTHYSIRSQTGLDYSAQRVMSDLVSELEDVDIDLVLSANDRFQQILDLPGEPLHVGTNGGGRQIEDIETIGRAERIAISRRGFAKVEATPTQLSITLYDANGENPIRRQRARVERDFELHGFLNYSE